MIHWNVSYDVMIPKTAANPFVQLRFGVDQPLNNSYPAPIEIMTGT
jgi:hypothetical protein